MNKDLVIITPTFNRAECLQRLYASLKNQINKEFVWFICNDGGTDNTSEIVTSFLNEGIIKVKYIEKMNSGKSRTLNEMLSRINDFKFALIVDDDEILFDNAVSTVYEYMRKYINTDCGVIAFNRKDMKGRLISNFDNSRDLFMSYQEKVNKGYHSDGYVGYFTEKLGHNRFPVFGNEKYVAPSVLVLLVSRHASVLWASPSIGKTEYRDDGISKGGRSVRVKSPRGMIYHALMMQDFKFKLKTRCKYSVLGYAYISYSNYRVIDVIDYNIQGLKFIKICRPLGFILSLYWKLFL